MPTAANQPRIWPRNESHQPPGADPAGQKGEGTRVQHGDREGSAPAQRVCHAGNLATTEAWPKHDTRLSVLLCLYLVAAQSCFLVQVTVSGQSAEGMGPSKKVAKRNAAEKMLELLGYKMPQPQPPKPALKTDEKVQLQAYYVKVVDKQSFNIPNEPPCLHLHVLSV